MSDGRDSWIWVTTHANTCRWERTTSAECEYRATHHYCPHPEHACNCPPAASPAIPEGAPSEPIGEDERDAALASIAAALPDPSLHVEILTSQRTRIAALESEVARLTRERDGWKAIAEGNAEVVEAAKDIRCTVGTIVPNFLKPLDAALSRLSAYNWEHDFENPIAPGQG